MLLHATDFFRLTLNRHVLVNESEAAFLRQSNRQIRFSHGIHRCGQHRDIQTDFSGQLSTEVGSIRQNCGVGWNKENVVER
ncbi:hypothetical protein SRABI106_03412 [Rahnella aquatilis]|nr:hypothetical protein SRABI106_03412 [Rahnella aquatilis]